MFRYGPHLGLGTILALIAGLVAVGHLLAAAFGVAIFRRSETT
jgi:hypothetical protein